jgi:hypothetical protein
MLHAGLDLSRRRLDVCLVDDAGELVARLAAAPDADVCAISPGGSTRGVCGR